MMLLDYVALAVFLLCWLGLEPAMARKLFGGNGIMAHMEQIRGAWMRQLLQRDSFLVDAQIIGHTINSASFFGSANLLVIVGVGGTLFGARGLHPEIASVLPLPADAPFWLFGAKIMLILAPLMRGLLDFIWAVRQLNYCLAAIASNPSPKSKEDIDAWADALMAVLNPALRTFSVGVRSYHFSIAAALWLFGPVPLIIGAVGSIAFLYWRQTRSGAANGLYGVCKLLAKDRLEAQN
ncbi:DUF599 domain-containing protein [Lacibacterium aquatile]|uniref:DUF599 domain-containing protein n=1 Tax=Lacibacterium aquatile TaxID=1168082 RepID=A0ABW5DNL3_9PROT